MNSSVKKALAAIQETHRSLLNETWDYDHDRLERDAILNESFRKETSQLDQQDRLRVQNELEKLGPLEILLRDGDVTEILVNRFDQVIFEKFGRLTTSADFFFDEITYNNCVERLCQMCGSYINREKPFIEMQVNDWRITIIYRDLSRGQHLLSIRKKSEAATSLSQLYDWEWCDTNQLEIIKRILSEKKNFVVVGATSSGKTTVLQALLNEISQSERCVIIEDTQELNPPNPLSVSLLTRQDALQNQYSVHMDDLLRRALRLRPDRIVVGEIRGGEAKDLLMALSTGHEGSFGSMHARNEFEALLRLEMLIQMGASRWTQDSIRKLIGLTVNYIIVVKKENEKRRLKGVYKVASVEATGITLMKVETLEDLWI